MSIDEPREIIYAAQPEAVMGKADPGERRVYLVTQNPEVSHPVISEADATALYDIRCELERARGVYPSFPNLYAAKDEIFNRARQLSSRLTISSGKMDAEVRRKVIQTAAMCLRALTENNR